MDDQARWSAVVRRDPSVADAFVYAVRTTGVACRPACASRTPRRANVEFFGSLAEAVRAGYRPCKRCHAKDAPSESERGLVRACRRLEAEEEGIRTADVAEELGMTASAFVRAFRKRIGVTPQQYRRRVLAERAKVALARGVPVTEAVYEAGYSSSSRFYEGVGQELGMRPRAARTGGRGESVRYAMHPTRLGRVAIAWTDRGVCDVFFAADEAEAAEQLGRRFAEATRAPAETPSWLAEVVAAVDGEKSAHVPLDVQGTAFQARVWAALRAIPFGETRSYGEIARAIGAPKAHRAVARAVGQNRLAVLVPCHRVIGADGALTGYRWGVDRKRALLEREAREASGATESRLEREARGPSRTAEEPSPSARKQRTGR